jgi:hypothetical protein
VARLAGADESLLASRVRRDSALLLLDRPAATDLTARRPDQAWLPLNDAR